jgi:hypothetical protein
MPKLKVGVIDLVGKGPSHTLWAKIMHANLASVMPQVVATRCKKEGHDVFFVCYTGKEDLQKELPCDLDLVFITSFTQAALLAYALSNYFRSKGVITALGGPLGEVGNVQLFRNGYNRGSSGNAGRKTSPASI